jgi:hypothetical protein
VHDEKATGASKGSGLGSISSNQKVNLGSLSSRLFRVIGETGGMATKDSNTEDHSLDIFGIKPIAHAVEKVTDTAVDKAAGFLTLICRPAAEEYGLLWRDKVKMKRAINAVHLVTKAEQKFKSLGVPQSYRANPRLVARIIEEGSWIEEDDLQDMWAGLLTSSCSPDGKDDRNLLFINYLSQITSVEARILHLGCTSNPMRFGANKQVWPEMHSDNETRISHARLTEFTKESDYDRLQMEFDHLVALGLLAFTFGRDFHDKMTFIVPTPLAISLFVRCQGSNLSPAKFFGLSE